MHRLLVFITLFFVGCLPQYPHIFEEVEKKSNEMYYIRGVPLRTPLYFSELNGYIKLPRLPYGYYLEYSFGRSVSGYPILLHANFSLYDVKQLYIARDGIYVKSADSNEMMFIDYEKCETVVTVDKTDFEYERLIEFRSVDVADGYENDYYSGGGYSMKAASIEDATKNKEDKTDIGNSVVDDILKLSMVNVDGIDVFVGQAICGHFAFYPKTGMVKYFKDETEYNAFVLGNFDTHDNLGAWESPFLYESEKKVSNFINYTEMLYVSVK